MKLTNSYSTLKKINRYKVIYLFLLPAFASVMIFSYRPMLGIIIAFQDYNVVKGIWGSKFVGLANFKDFLTDPYFYSALKNTLCINGLSILIGFPLPIIFALMIFSMRDSIFKRVNQTISYLPHFISWVVVAGLLYKITDESSGIINLLLGKLGFDPVPFFKDPQYFWYVAIVVGIWKELGWISIIYLAALAGVEAEQYEAAMIDGANGLQKLVYITIPGILPTISIVMIFSLGAIINTSGYFVLVPFDAIYNLRNPMVADTANTLDFYIYQSGVLSSKYSYATALGISQGLLAFLMVMTGNWFSKKVQGKGAF